MMNTTKNVQGDMIRPTVFNTPAASEAATGHDAVMRGVASGPVLNGPALTITASTNYDDLLEILNIQNRSARLDLLHCNLAHALTMLNNNNAAENADLTIIVTQNDEIAKVNEKLEYDLVHDPVIQKAQIEIDDLDKQIRNEKDPDKRAELEAKKKETEGVLANRRAELTNAAKGKIEQAQAKIDAAYSHLSESQRQTLAVAVATASAAAQWRALSKASDDAGQAKATLDGMESLALHLDKHSPGFKQACESVQQQVDYMLNRRLNYS